MKKKSIITALVLTLLMVISSFSSVFAEGYGYTVTIYAGKQGSFSDGSKVKTVSVSQGEDVDIAQLASDAGFKVTNDEYYCRGFRETGHDNDESPSLVAFKADEDVSYEAAYGIKGGMVKYTVMYVDPDGAELVDSNEYYGMVGDKPVVSYHYIDGYQPNAYNLTKKLVADEGQNVFAFSYLPLPEGAEAAADNADGNNGQAGARNAANGQTAGANAAANDANANAPATIVDLDDNATPQAENAGGTSDIAETDIPKAGISPIAIGGGVAAVAAIAALAAFLIRRRNAEYEDDDEDEAEAYSSDSQHAYLQQE